MPDLTKKSSTLQKSLQALLSKSVPYDEPENLEADKIPECVQDLLSKHEFENQVKGKCTNRVYGAYTSSDKQFPAFDQSGNPLTVKIVCEGSVTTPNSAATTVLNDSTDLRPASTVACDSNAQIAERISALREWINQSDSEASDFILSELNSLLDEASPYSSTWLVTLIFAAEDAKFATQQFPELLKQLSRFIHKHRTSDFTHVDRAVFAAIRRYASLVPVESANTLFDFISNGDAVDTRVPVLVGLANVYAYETCSFEDTNTVRDRLEEFARKATDPDMFTAGNVAAIAENSLFLLAILDDPRTLSILSQRQKSLPYWFHRLIRNRLTVFLQTSNLQNGSKSLKVVAELLDVLSSK